jgi:hypothetical protein
MGYEFLAVTERVVTAFQFVRKSSAGTVQSGYVMAIAPFFGVMFF